MGTFPLALGGERGLRKGSEGDVHTHRRVKVYLKDASPSVRFLDVLHQKAPYTIAVSGLLSFKDTEGTQSSCSRTIATVVHLAANMPPAQSFDAVI